MNDCEYYQRLMSQLLDSGLDEDDTRELRGHLRTCADCRAVLEALSSITLTLRADIAEPSAALAGSVMARIAAEEKKNAPVPVPAEKTQPPVPTASARRATHRHAATRRTAPWLRLGAAACLMLIIAGGTVTVLHRRTKLTADTAAAARSIDAVVSQAAAGAADAPMEAAEFAMSGVIPETMTEEAEAETPMDAAETAAPDTGAAVYGPDGAFMGSIPPGELDAFDALLTALDTGQDDSSQADWIVICTVVIHDIEYTFGTDAAEERLVWWDNANGEVTLSSGTADDLRSLIIAATP